MSSVFSKLKDTDLFSTSENEVVKFILSKPQKMGTYEH